MFIRFRGLFASHLACLGLSVLSGLVPVAVATAAPVRPPAPGGRYDLPSGSCSDRYWIALAEPLATPQSCPKVRGWREEFLFPASRRNPNGRRFCRYLWNRPALRTERGSGDRGFPPQLGNDILRLQGRADLHGTVRRCGVLGASGQGLAESHREALFHEMRFQLGDIDVPALSDAPTVRLAVLDTFPSGKFPPGAPNDPNLCSSGHGYAIAHLARELTCDGSAGDFGKCAAEIATRLALPLGQPGSDAIDRAQPSVPTACGAYGSPLDLALAIRDEVAAWETAGPPHLILNLSVGWDGELLHKALGAEASDGLNAEELSVFAALRDAAGQGVLAIAAAGNGYGGPQPGTGPLLPAAWYIKPPTTPLLAPVPLAPPDPVIWPIGAIDRNGRRLGNFRPGSEPPLVAYGDHAVVQLANGRWTDPLTGSSVGAVVASSLAALAWHFQPLLDRVEIMALLESSGAPMDRSPDYPSSPGQTAPSVRRLRVTSLLSRAWSPPRLQPPSGPTTHNEIDCANAQPVSPAAGGVKIYSCPGTDVPPDSADLLLWSPLGAVPWVQTQPGANACPSCSLGSGGGGLARGTKGPKPIDLLLEIPTDWNATICLNDLWIEASDRNGSRTLVWLGKPARGNPGPTPLCPTDSLWVKNLPFPPNLEAAALTAGVEVDGKKLSLRMPIYINPEK